MENVEIKPKRGPGRPKKVTIPVIPPEMEISLIENKTGFYSRSSKEIQIQISNIPEVPAYSYLSRKSATLIVVDYPTSNCQLASIGNIQSILSGISKEAFKKILATLYKGGQLTNIRTPNIILVDVKVGYLSTLMSFLPPNSVISSNPYVSTNGSVMNIVLFKTGWIFE